jgi:hypothetical protein
MTWRTTFMATLLFAGFATGILTGTGEGKAGWYQYDVWNHPGPTYSTTTINCGWHDDCDAGAGNANALDWRNADNDDVLWRSFSSNESNQSFAGSILIQDLSEDECHRTFVELRTLIGTHLGEIQYKHTTPVGDNISYSVSSGLNPTSFYVKVGDTHDWDCGTYRAHLHQGRESGTAWTKQTQSTWIYPTWSTCHTAGCYTVSGGPWQYWQHQRTWSASY